MPKSKVSYITQCCKEDAELWAIRDNINMDTLLKVADMVYSKLDNNITAKRNYVL